MSKEDFTKEQLIDRIQYLYETDVGDFRRKASLYLNRFAQSQRDSEMKKQIQSLKNTVLYSEITSERQMDNIDKLRFDLLEQLKKM